MCNTGAQLEISKGRGDSPKVLRQIITVGRGYSRNEEKRYKFNKNVSLGQERSPTPLPS